MRINELNKNSTNEEVEAALSVIAGMPHHLRENHLLEVHLTTGRDKTSVWGRFAKYAQKREVTKHSRLKLKSLLKSIGVEGVEGLNTLTIPDPLIPGDEITVRDATLLGHRPIVEKTNGYAHHIDAYVAALVGQQDVAKYTIQPKEIKKLAGQLRDCDAVKEIAPRLLSTPNLPAFEEVLGQYNQQLIVALKMNKRYSIVENGGQLVIFDNETRGSYALKDFQSKMATEGDTFIYANNEKEYVPRYKTWFYHPARAYYSGVTFAPMGCDVHGRELVLDRTYNLWTGFAQTGAKGDWSKLREHIRTVLCRGDEECFEYLLNWMAHLFQKPWEKPGVAVVVWGKKRTGKGTVADAIRETLGPHISRMFTHKEHVVGRFAGSAQPIMFNQIEEAVFAKDPREEGPLKSKITDPTETVELKFKTPYEVSSFGRWWFNSNSPTPVPITHDEERYFVLHISDAHANDHAYFDAIRRQLYHEGGLAAMVHDLMRRDILKFNVRKPPHTDHRAKMVFEMFSPQDRAIADILIESEVALLDSNKGTFVFSERLDRTSPTWVDKEKVRSTLNHAFKKYGAKEASPGDIAALLKELGVIDKERNAHQQRGYAAGYRFRPLNEARGSFAKARNISVDMLKGADGERTPEEEFQDAAAALGELINKHDDSSGAPENFHAIRKAVNDLQAAVSTSDKHPVNRQADGTPSRRKSVSQPPEITVLDDSGPGSALTN